MQSHYQILSAKRADRFYWIPPTDHTHIAGLTVLPLHAGEMAAAASTMPLAFAQQDGQWKLMAVVGVQPQHNLFVRDGKWLGRYRPVGIDSYDFDMQQVADIRVMRFNTAGKLSANAGAAGAESMFDEQGKYSEKVRAIAELLQRTAPRYAITDQAVQALADAGVLAPWPQALKESVGMKLDGLYFTDESALNALSDRAFLHLRQQKALGIAYAVNLSLQQVHLLERLNHHNPAVDDIDDVDELFGESDSSGFDDEDDILKW